MINDVVGDIHVRIPGRDYAPAEIIENGVIVSDYAGGPERPDPLPVPRHDITVCHADGIPGNADSGAAPVFNKAAGDFGRGPAVQRNSIPPVASDIAARNRDFGPFAAEDPSDADHHGIEPVVVVADIEIMNHDTGIANDDRGIGSVAVGVPVSARNGQVGNGRIGRVYEKETVTGIGGEDSFASIGTDQVQRFTFDYETETGGDFGTMFEAVAAEGIDEFGASRVVYTRAYKDGVSVERDIDGILKIGSICYSYGIGF